MVHKCLFCNKEFAKRWSGVNKFCSRVCYINYKKDRSEKNKIMRICLSCGSNFKIKSFELNNREYKANFCSKQCYWKNMKGNKQFTKNLGKFSKRNGVTGKNHPRWIGITSIEKEIRACTRYLEWRKKVYKRDEYGCRLCGNNKGGNLEAHHIIPLSGIIKRFCVTNLQEAHDIEQIWDVNNGLTLCSKCHKKTDTFGEKAKKFSYLTIN